MPSTSNSAAVVAAAASAAAGAIHAAAAGSHAELTTLSRLFAVAAVAQIAWAAAVLWRQGRAVAWAGVGINLAALGAWAVTRSTAIDGIAGLEQVQAVGFPDGLAAGLAVLAAVGAALSLGSTVLPRLARAAVPAIVAVIAVATVPAMATPHDHGSHDHGTATAAGHDDGSHAHDDDGHGHAGPTAAEVEAVAATDDAGTELAPEPAAPPAPSAPVVEDHPHEPGTAPHGH